MNKLTVVIPSRNSSNLVPCMEAIRRNEPGIRIIVVDDGLDLSWCPRPDLMPNLFVRGDKPFIFARAMNHGIIEAGSDDVVLCNDDALLQTADGFSLLQKAAEEHPEVGLIAATCNNVGNTNQWNQGTMSLREDPRMVCFVCVFIPRRTIESVGLLDERFVKYGLDDDDYCLRVKNAGLKIGIHDGCYVDHGSLTSSYRGPAGAGGDFCPNLKLFIEKWGVDNRGLDKASSPWSDLFPS